MKRKVVAVMLSLTMLMTVMVGCGKQEGQGSQESSQQQESSQETGGESKEGTSEGESEEGTSEGESGGALDPWAKYDEPVTVEFVKAVDIAGDAVDYTQGNPFYDFVRDNFNIDIKFKWVTPSASYDQKFATMLVGDDLADIMVVNMTTMKQLYESKQIQPLTEVFNTLATDETKSLMGYGNAISFDTGTIDGEMYGIPLTTPVLETMHALFLRKDWLDNLNMSEPTSFEELEKVLYAFTNDDPDGNGQNDTYGFGLSKDLFTEGYEARSLANEMHAYPDAWVEKDGKIVYGSVQPEMRDVLETLAKWYKDGVIDPEFIGKDFNQEGELTAKGKVGAYYGVQWAQFQGDSMSVLWREDTNSEWVLIGIPSLSIDDQPAKAIVYDNSSNFIVVREGFEHPEIAVKLLNILHKVGAGDARDYFETEEDFRNVWDYWGWMPFAPESVHGNITKWINVFGAIEKDDPSLVEYNYNALALYNDQMKYLFNNDYRNSDDTEAKSSASGQYSTRFSGYMFGYASEYAEKGLLEYDKRGAIVTDTMVDSLATLDKLELETFTRIITGEDDISAFDDFVNDWNRLGGEQIVQEMNEFYGY